MDDRLRASLIYMVVCAKEGASMSHGEYRDFMGHIDECIDAMELECMGIKP